MTSYPPPAIGGPVLTGDLLNCVVDQHIGHSGVSRHEVVDAIDRCIGMSDSVQSRLFWKQAANPLYYLIVFLAFVIRAPFLVLRQAGIPKEVEHTLWGHIVKALMLALLLLAFVRYGLKFSLGDLVGFLK
jgi:hypothetical protein